MSCVSQQQLLLSNPSYEAKRRNFLQPLQPRKRQIDSTEAECVYRIAVSAAERFRSARALVCIIQDDSLIFKVRDEEIRNAIMKHQCLQERHLPSDGWDCTEIGFSLKNILRVCQGKGFSLVNHVPSERLNEDSMSAYLQGLMEIIREKLLTEPKEDVDRKRMTCLVLEKNRILQRLITELSLKLETSEIDLIREKQAKDHEIMNLKVNIDTIQTASLELNGTVLTESAKDIIIAERNSDAKKTKMQQNIINLKAEMSKQRRSHFEAESFLRKRKFKLRGELSNWIHKYDDDMSWRQNELDSLREQYESNLAEVDALKIHFNELQKSYESIIEEHERKRAELEARRAEELRHIKASTTIQAFWRGYLVRRNLRTGKDGKEAGKGKVKKGGKRKKK